MTGMEGPGLLGRNCHYDRVIAQSMRSQSRELVAGLLHDIGKVFLYAVPHDYHRALTLARERALSRRRGAGFFDSTHAEIASWALERWCLPSQLIEAIKYHLTVLATTWGTGAAVVHVSGIFTRSQGYGWR
jgi:HD-like signal output (HDOD) protein